MLKRESIQSHSDLIDLWPHGKWRTSFASFAEETGLPPSLVRTMYSRRVIGPAHWPNVIAAARARNWDWIDADLMLKLYLKKYGGAKVHSHNGKGEMPQEDFERA